MTTADFTRGPGVRWKGVHIGGTRPASMKGRVVLHDGRRVPENLSSISDDDSVSGPYMSTRALKPPYTIRLTSKGISISPHAASISFMTFALTRSRCARDL